MPPAPAAAVGAAPDTLRGAGNRGGGEVFVVVDDAPRQGIYAQACLRRSFCSRTAMQWAESNANESFAPLSDVSTAGSTATGEDADAAVMEPPAKRAKSLKANTQIDVQTGSGSCQDLRCANKDCNL
jgi:hypothetical protein